MKHNEKIHTLTFIPQKEAPYWVNGVLIPVGHHYWVKELNLCCSLPEVGKAGVCTLKNFTVGVGHSAHPNIDQTGSVEGMKNLGYWGKDDKTVLQGGFIYNVSVISVQRDNLLDELCNSIEKKYTERTLSSDGTVTYKFQIVD